MPSKVSRNGHMPSPYGGLTDPLVVNQVKELVANVTMMRREWQAGMFDPRRDLNDECGYPRDGEDISVEEFQRLYDRDAIAQRVVQVYPLETWQVQPTIYEDEDVKTVTPFEETVDALGSQLRGGQSYYRSEAGSPVWEYLRRVDLLSGIGQYGVILLGLDDGLDLRQPAVPDPNRHLLFLRVFPESLAMITRLEANPLDPRYGQPVEYNLTLADPRSPQPGAGQQRAVAAVHWSRVIHVADNLESSEVYGISRLKPVLNRLLDLRKIYAGDGEAYWKNVLMRLFFETHPSLGGDADINESSLRDAMENMENGMQRWMALLGFSVKPIAPQVVDPTSHVNTQIEAICIKLGIPKRVFMGSERGELASSQDDAAWNDRLRERQNNYVTPRIIVPFVDRLIQLGVLPEPSEFYVSWPDLTSQTDEQKTAAATQKTQALATYVKGGVETLVPPMDYLTRVLGFNEEEAETILENAADIKDEKEAEAKRLADEQGFESTPPEGFEKPPEVPAPGGL